MNDDDLAPLPSPAPEKPPFNLSDWALDHASLVWYFIIVFSLAGFFAYNSLGREEDPSFTIKTMVVSAQWPGASLDETLEQVTDRIEKKLEELPTLDFTRSLTTPGQTTVFVNLKDTVRGRAVSDSWRKVREMLGDIRGRFPQGVLGPGFNDDFGDVYGNVYAFVGDGLSARQLRDYADDARTKLLSTPDIGKIDLIGAQDEAIYLEFSTRRMAALGLNLQAVAQSLQAQNTISPSGVVEAGPERVRARVGGQFASEESLRDVNLRVGERMFRLEDIAEIKRGYVDPPSGLFRFGGKPAVGLAIGMKAGGNLLTFGERLNERMAEVVSDLPVGVNVHLVADQPIVVEEAVGGFTKALGEAVAIVLAVSFISLGVRAGFVVALSIPLVLAMTFLGMQYLGVSLQRISLGALIIALGLLVDDAMIAVETMVARLEAGDSLRRAATHVYTSTAFPMLTGTLVTMAGFIPIGLNSSAAGEYTFTLFVVIALSLLLSWIVAVIFTPLLGVTFLPNALKAHKHGPGPLGRAFRRLLELAMRWRWATIAITLGIFVFSLTGMKYVEQQFFPSSDRPELIVDFSLPQSASIAETKAQMDRFEAHLKDDPDVSRWSSYVGQSAVRFVLAFDVVPPSPAFGQMVIIAKDIHARDRVRARLRDIARQEFVGTDILVNLLPLGPPAGRPVQYRLSGPDLEVLREQAQRLAAMMDRHPRVIDVGYDWMEPALRLKVEVNQDKARRLGLSSQDVSSALNAVTGGAVVTQIRDGAWLVNVVARAPEEERSSVETLRRLQLSTPTGQPVPLAAVADFRYEVEQPQVWRRARVPTLTVRGGIIDATQPDTIMKQLAPEAEAFAKTLPHGYKIEMGGPVEESAKAQGPIAAVAPLMLFVMTTILMIQLQSFQRLFLVMAVAPLGMIGVVGALLMSRAPLGFVAILGVLALVGILIRNSVILIVQVEDLRKSGVDPWEAVITASLQRARPILLTAAAASLALIPISREVFWGPMAYAMMGGIIVGTLLTLIFLPALYVAWFRLKAPRPPPLPPEAEAPPA